MIIDLDIGNTRVKWRCHGHDVAVMDDYNWAQLFQRWRTFPGDVTRIRVSSVISSRKFDSFREGCIASVGIEPEVAHVRQGAGGVTLVYSDVSQLGTDRWLAMLAARARLPAEHLMVVNAGSALTIDVLCASGQHIGGYIVPGLRTSSRALYAKTDGVGAPDVVMAPAWPPGDGTLPCVEGGFGAMYQGFLMNVWQQASAQVGFLRPIFTGGDGREMAALMQDRCACLLDHTLVLDGIAIALP